MGEGKTHQTNLEREAGLLDLVGEIYQAGLEPERWPATIARMSQAFQADLACIYTPFPARPEQALYLTHNFTGEMEQAYSAYYHHLDEWTRHALRQRRYIQGTVALGEEIVPQAELRRTEYYNDFTSRYTSRRCPTLTISTTISASSMP